MLINAIDPEESRIAVVEDGVLQELHVELASREAYLGNIYKGKVVNIEPSIGAAFVAFGGRVNGFLHVSDVLPAYGRDDFRLEDVIEGRARVDVDDGPESMQQALSDDDDDDDDSVDAPEAGAKKKRSRRKAKAEEPADGDADEDADAAGGDVEASGAEQAEADDAGEETGSEGDDVAVVALGLLARYLFGRLVSLAVTAIAAVYANLWINDGILMSETPAALVTVGVLFAVYWYERVRSPWAAIVMGAAIGLAGLARSELLLLGVLVVLPLVLSDGHRPIRGRLAHLGLAALAAVVLVSPWVIRNQVRFDEPTFMSTQDGLTLLGANGLLFWVLVKLLPGIEVDGILPAIAAPVVYTLLSVLISTHASDVDVIESVQKIFGFVEDTRDQLLVDDPAPGAE